MALTSILGAQTTRLNDISQEWKRHTKDLVEQTGHDDAIDFTITVSDTSSGGSVDSTKTKVFEYITEQSDDTIAVYGANNIEKASYDRVLTDIQWVMDSLDPDVKQPMPKRRLKTYLPLMTPIWTLMRMKYINMRQTIMP